jgi:hypothetical protein
VNLLTTYESWKIYHSKWTGSITVCSFKNIDETDYGAIPFASVPRKPLFKATERICLGIINATTDTQSIALSADTDDDAGVQRQCYLQAERELISHEKSKTVK